jgi:hypothetical protein
MTREEKPEENCKSLIGIARLAAESAPVSSVRRGEVP